MKIRPGISPAPAAVDGSHPLFKQRLLAEFGLEIGDDVELRVVDSTADVRYLVILVIPCRPPGTDQLSEEQLAALITRDCMTGVAQPAAPALA
jgi:nitrile hydratase